MSNMENDHSKYFSFETCKTKFEVKELIKKIDAVEYPENADIIDFLFECLQDINWPFFEDAVECIKNNYPTEFVLEAVERKLAEAEEDKDYMWIGGIYYLLKAMDISTDRLSEQACSILEHRDF